MIGRGKRTVGRRGGWLVLVRLLLAAAAVWLQPGDASAEFKIRHHGTSGHLVIFVHGLWGKPLESFTAEGEKSWLDLMKEDKTSFGGSPPLSTYSTATLGYPARTSDNHDPTDITAKLMGDLAAEPELEKHQAIYFVGHSFGGLVVEQLLVDAHLSGSLLAKRTRAVFLIATPSQGAELAKVAARLPGWARGQLVVNLDAKDMPNFLKGLQRQWHAVLEKRQKESNPIAFACAYETEPTGNLWKQVIVPEANIDGRCNNRYPIKADHIQIVKPTKREDEIYQWLLRNLAALNRPAPKDAKPAETAEARPSTAAPTAKAPEEQQVPAAPRSPDPSSKQPLHGGKVALSAPQQEGAKSSEKPGGVIGQKDTAAVPASPVIPPPATSAAAGMPVLRLAGLERMLDATVRLHWGRLQRKAKLLAKDGEDGTATHELNVVGAKKDRPADCTASVEWKLTWTLEFELVPLIGAGSSRRGKVTEGVCYGTEEQRKLEKNALEAAVLSMIRELETWSIQ